MYLDSSVARGGYGDNDWKKKNKETNKVEKMKYFVYRLLCRSV